ncbi:hypothetical protein OKW43_002256 [Paraburkholderia sp. WC7.3g]|uniref:hypothetical protein n=1 Tax=Paraburkholderia sp. WC7.3g TaxID=2991070 RepID=UPI003D1F6F7E
MKSITHTIRTMMLFGGALCNVTIAAPSLCESPESVVFSCSTATSKIIALCMDARTQEIVYRFGKVGKIEMCYSAKQGSEHGFLYNHYVRPSVDYMRISFMRAGYEYSVFRNYDATESQVSSYGVAVSKDGSDEMQIKCKSQVVDRMSIIIEQLKCDESSALGCF